MLRDVLSEIMEEQIIGVLKEGKEAAKTADLARRHGISEATIYNERSGMATSRSEAKRLLGLDDENAQLMRLLVETMLDNAGLKDLLPKIGDARCEVSGGRVVLSALKDQPDKRTARQDKLQ